MTKSSIAFAAAFVLMAISAQADTLPPPMYTAYLGLNSGTDTTYTVTGGYGNTAIVCEPSFDCVSTTITPDDASTTLFGFPFMTSVAQANFTYSWKIMGPQLSGIPIQISYDNSYEAAGISNASSWAISSSLNATTDLGPIGNNAFCNNVLSPDCTPPVSIGAVSSSRFSSNVVYSITLSVLGQITDATGNGGEFLTANSDPVISFGPGFDSTGYSIVVNDAAPTVTPEPASLALIGIGMTGLALMRRKRRG